MKEHSVDPASLSLPSNHLGMNTFPIFPHEVSAATLIDSIHQSNFIFKLNPKKAKTRESIQSIWALRFSLDALQNNYRWSLDHHPKRSNFWTVQSSVERSKVQKHKHPMPNHFRVENMSFGRTLRFCRRADLNRFRLNASLDVQALPRWVRPLSFIFKFV